MKPDHGPVAVLGAGSWGTALAALLARQGHAVTLWGRDAAVAEAINTRHENPRYLPGLALAAAASIFTGSEALHIPIAITVLLAMEAGAAAACLTATNGNGIRILREVE